MSRLCQGGFSRYEPELTPAEVCILCLGIEDEVDWMAAIPHVTGACPCYECRRGGKRMVKNGEERLSSPCYANCEEYDEFLLGFFDTRQQEEETA